MTMDKSLKHRGELVRARNVLSRAERIAAMRKDEHWTEGRTPFALPKVKVHRLLTKKKAKAKEETPAEGAAAAAGAAPAAAAAAPAADKKGDKKAEKKPEKGKGGKG